MGDASAAEIANNRGKYVGMSLDATAERAQASIGTTVAAAGVGSVWAASASMSAVTLATAGAVGVIAIPPLAPALLGVMIATIFVLRQKGLNKELLSNLYFIKMEAERMLRVHNVMKAIAKEHGINLNTANLSAIMTSLQKKIMLFADKQTTRDIEQLETFLKQGNLKAAQTFVGHAEGQGKVAAVAATTKQGGGAWLPTGWKSRWLSPDETLRQIIRDITIACVWFSIMLGEFDIFMRYMDAGNGKAWRKSDAMKELLIANKQLGTTTAQNSSNIPAYDAFYSSQDDMKAAVAGVEKSIQSGDPDSNPGTPIGGTRAKRRRRYSRNEAKTSPAKSRRAPR